MPQEFSCKVTIGDKPDWDKLGPEIINGFLLPLAEMVKEHRAGRLDIHCSNSSDHCRIEVEYSLGSHVDGYSVYAGHIKGDTRVALLERFKNKDYPPQKEWISLKQFLVGLAEFFKGVFEERTKHYAEAAAIGVVTKEALTRLQSIKATAHYE